MRRPPPAASVDALLASQRWLLPHPGVALRQLAPRLSVLRDDLLHPYAGGNKLRKLDGVVQAWDGAAHVLTCGGAQSAHCAAVAFLAAERGLAAHLLLRGEPPAVLRATEPATEEEWLQVKVRCGSADCPRRQATAGRNPYPPSPSPSPNRIESNLLECPFPR